MTTPPAKTRLLLLTESHIRELLSDRDAVGRFPFLRGAADRLQASNRTAKPGCSKCGRVTNSSVAEFNGLMQAIASLTPADKEELKRRFNAERIRVVYKTKLNKLEKLVF